MNIFKSNPWKKLKKYIKNYDGEVSYEVTHRFDDIDSHEHIHHYAIKYHNDEIWIEERYYGSFTYAIQWKGYDLENEYKHDITPYLGLSQAKIRKIYNNLEKNYKNKIKKDVKELKLSQK